GTENPTLAPYAHTGEVHLRLTARAETVGAAEALIEPVDARIRTLLGDAVFGTDTTTLEEAIQKDLAARGETVSVAESMTGGGLMARMSNAPGSSATFRGGVVVYAVDAKVRLLALDRHRLEEEGPVSEWAALSLSRSVREKLGTTHGIGIVGNAGPTSDVDGKPVGLVYVAHSGPGGDRCESNTFRGTRDDIRRRAEQTALTLLRRAVRRPGY
ncbi:MAG: competence/damage-inducible protein A, partial [Armatimonadota bacterium]